jgi:hypothetical protein
VKAVVVSYRQAPFESLKCFQRWLVPGLARADTTTKPGEENSMNAAKITGIVLIVIGLAGFFTGGFSFTKDTTAAKIGPIELKVQEQESVNIPQWLSLGALALGAIVLVAGFRKS